MREAEKVWYAAAGGGEGGEKSGERVTCRASRSSSAAASGVIVPSGPRAACAPASMPRSLRRPCTCVVEERWEVTDPTASRRVSPACAGWPLARDAVHTAQHSLIGSVPTPRPADGPAPAGLRRADFCASPASRLPRDLVAVAPVREGVADEEGHDERRQPEQVAPAVRDREQRREYLLVPGGREA